MNALGQYKFLLKHICNKQREVYNPLGCWNVDPNNFERLWPFYYSEKTGYIYRGFRTEWHSNDNYTYEIYESIEDEPTRYSFDKRDETNQLPTDAIPVLIEPTKTDWKLEQYHESIYQPPTGPVYFDFQSFLKTQKDHIT